MPLDLPISHYQTAGVNQKPAYGTDYPFLDAGDDVKYALSDLWLAYDDIDCGFILPLKITWMYGFGTAASSPVGGAPTPTHSRDMVIKDSSGAVVFDSTTATFVARAWGERLYTLEWIGSNGVLRATAHGTPGNPSAPPWAPTANVLQHLAPADGTLDPRTYMRMPKRVKSIRVGLTTIDTGDLILSEGYNCRLTSLNDEVRVDGGRLRHRLGIRFRPGDGLGRIPGCQDVEPVIKRINGQQPTPGGDFTIDTQGCYWLRRPVTITATSPRKARVEVPGLSEEKALAALQILNDCAPCCECDDFVRTYEGVRRLYNRYRDLGLRGEAVRNQFEDNIARWEKQRSCRLAASVRLTLIPERDFGLVIAGVYCNMTQCCLQNVTLRTTIEGFRDGAAIDITSSMVNRCRESVRAGADTNYNEVPYKPVKTLPHTHPATLLDHYFDKADPQGISRFRMRVAAVTASDGDVVRVTITAHVPEQSDTVSGAPCDFPHPEDVPAVPASVQAAWDDGAPPPATLRAVFTKSVPISSSAGCGGGDGCS